MIDAPLPSGNAPRSSFDRRLYFAVWRWHFYAGLYVIPFIVMLGITGLMMLWFTAIAPEYGERIALLPRGTALLPSALAEVALSAHPNGEVRQFITPWSAETPALLRVDGDGSRILAIDPYSGQVLRDTLSGDTWKELATDIHGSLLIGDMGDWLIEIAAGFGIILVATGLYLWWPREEGKALAMLVPDLSARGRAWWKSLHQVAGLWFSAALVFFLISGLAWTGVWGAKLVQAWSTFPAEKWDNVPLSDKSHASMNHGAEKGVPWTLEQTSLPVSGSDAGMRGVPAGTPVNLDAIVGLGRALGFEGRFQVAIPSHDTGVYTLSQDSQSYDSHSPTQDRTVHVDQYSGKILADVRFADYAAAGKAMAVGIALHEGMLGWWNVALNALFVLAILFVAASGVVMWWMRRPNGAARLGAPPHPASPRAWKGAGKMGVLRSVAAITARSFRRAFNSFWPRVWAHATKRLICAITSDGL